MTQGHMRTSDQVIRKLNHKINKTRDNGSAGLTAINTSDPNTLNGNVPRESDGHGVSGGQCMVTLGIGALGSAVTITVWLWDKIALMWLKLGADSTVYSKTFDSKTIDGFAIPELAVFYLQGSANVDDAWIDCDYTPYERAANGLP